MDELIHGDTFLLSSFFLDMIAKLDSPGRDVGMLPLLQSARSEHEITELTVKRLLNEKHDAS